MYNEWQNAQVCIDVDNDNADIQVKLYYDRYLISMFLYNPGEGMLVD